MAAEIEDPNKTALKQRFLDEINSRQGLASLSVLVDVVKEDDDEGSILWAKWFHPLADLWDLLRGEGRGRGGFRRLRDEEEEQGDNNNIGGGAGADSSDDDEEEESDPEGYLVGRCFQELPEENLLQFFTEIFAWRPQVRLHYDVQREKAPSLFHLAVRMGSVTPLSVLRLLADPGLAMRSYREGGMLPLHLACQKRLPSPVIEFLIELNSEALAVSSWHGWHPLHEACFHRLDPSIIERIMDGYPSAVGVRDENGYSPAITLIKRARVRGPRNDPRIVDLILRMIDQEPGPLGRVMVERHWRTANVYRTALMIACENCPDERLIRKLIEVWPFALIVWRHGSDGGRVLFGFDRRISLPVDVLTAAAATARNPGNAAAPPIHGVQKLVEDHTCAVEQAVVDVLLHETARDLGDGAQDHVRDCLRPFLDQSPRGGAGVSLLAAVAPASRSRLRSRILCNDPLQKLLRKKMAASEPIHEMILGMCRMNRAGRSPRSDSEPADGFVLDNARWCKELRILEAAMGNVDCLFVHLRDCPSLFAWAVAGGRAAASSDGVTTG